MHRFILVAGLILAVGLTASADYISGRRAAAELGRTGKHQEAVSAFSNLVSEAAAVKDMPASQQAMCEKRVKELQANAK